MCKHYFFFTCKKKFNYFNEVVDNALLDKPNEECSICLEPLKLSSCIVTNHCNHVFHKKCYISYIESDTVKKSKRIHCPYCNTFQRYI